VMLAMLFMFEVRREHKSALSLLSCHDIVEVLRVLLPRANMTYEDILLWPTISCQNLLPGGCMGHAGT
jgi:hypothetical protein